MKRKTTALLLLVLAVALTLVGTALAADAAGAESWQVSVGKETDAASLDSMFPKVIFIHEGDKVTFTNGAKFTPHTVTFLAGQPPLSPEDPTTFAPTAPSGVVWDGKTLLNSGMLMPTANYEITFTASGAYAYYCALHPMMTGTVVVVPKGQPIPSKVEQAASVKAQEQEIMMQAQSLLGNAEASVTANGDGSLTYGVSMGSGHTTFSHNRMMPELVVVSEGDSVKWTNLNPYEPHFVTFSKPADLNFFNEKGEFNPKFMAPAGGNSFNGKGFTNSGMVMGGQAYSLKFTKAGTYMYECYLHAGSKMTGTVVVVPKNAVKVIVNGKVVAKSAGAMWKNGSLNVTVAAFAQALGGKASADAKMKLTTVTVGKLKVSVKAVNGQASAEEIVRGLGGSYAWNQQTKSFTVTIAAGAAAAPAAHAHH